MYRESLERFIVEDRARLFVPKNGGLNVYVRGILEETGVKEGKLSDGRSIDILMVRGEDIPTRVADSIRNGKAAYGLTGDDLFDEFMLGGEGGLCALNTYDWCDPQAEWGRPALSFMSKEGTFESLGQRPKVAVNKKYARTSRTYLEDRVGKDCAVREYAGDTEQTVAEGTNDACIEIVYRGDKSMESAKAKAALRTIEVVRFSDIVLIGKEEKDPFQEEYSRILARKRTPTDTYTSKLLADPNRIVKKFGEESAELVQAYATGKNLTGEALDVMYGTMLMLAEKGTGWNDIEQGLRARWG